MTTELLFQVIKFNDNGHYAIARSGATISTIRREYTMIQTDMTESDANDLCEQLMAENNQPSNPFFD